MALNEILAPTNVSLTGNVSSGFSTSELTTLADGSFVLAYVDLVDGSEVIWTIFTSEGVPIITGGTPASIANREADPDIVALSGGGFALTWVATRDDQIFATVYDENGAALVIPFGVSEGPSSLWPQVAALSNDVYALTWFQVTTVTVDGSPVSNYEVYTAVYDAQGDEIAAPVLVSVADGVSDQVPKIAVLSNGDYALTWTKNPSDGIPEIYTVVYTALGAPVAAATNVGIGANTQIAALEDGGYALTWVTSEVMTAVFDNTGVQVSASVAVASAVDTRIAALENGNYALFWSDGVDAWTAVYNDQGAQVSAPVNVTIANPLIDYASDIQVLSNGAYALTWRGETEAGSVGAPGTSDIFIAVFDGQGQQVIAPVNVSNTPGLDDDAATLTALAEGSFAVAWQGGVDGAFFGDQFMAIYQFAPTQPPNEPPTAATTNSVVTDEDTASTAVPIGAEDADGDVLSYGVKFDFAPAKGTVSFAAGSFVYTPGANANGTDSFTILIDDGHGGTAEQAVTVTINPRNDPAIIGGTVLRSVNEDGGAGEIATGQLTITDVDGTAEQVFQAGVIVGDYGSLTVTASGSWTYVLDNDNAAVQALDTGGALTDTIVVQSIDGTAKDIVIAIKGADEESPNTVRYYLLIDGVDGGSRAEGHEGWFEISDYDFDMTSPTTIGSVTGGAGAGRLEFPPLTVTLGLGLGQADLFETIARGLHLTGVRFEGVTADGERVFDLTLGSVFLSDIEDRASGLDTLTMGYGQAWLETYTQTDSGEGPVQRYAWDQAANREITDPPPDLQPGSARGEAATPVRYYLLLDGIDGGSTAEGHKGWFEISDYDFDLTNPATTLVSAGRLQFAPLTVTLGLGLGETDLFETIARGLHFTGVRIEGVTADGERAFDLTLGTVFLTQIEDRGGERDALTMVYGQAWLETYTQIEPGVAGPVQRYAWDQLTNKAITEPPPELQPDSAGGEVATPARYYLLIDGVDGGSRAEGHEGWFEISDYDFDMTSPTTIGSVTGGAGAGRLEFPPLTVTLGLGLGQADLFETIARGLHLTGVRFEGVTADGERVFDLTLGSVFLSDIEDRASGLDTLTMGYGQAWLETYTQTDSGEGPVQRYAWDQAANREITDPPPDLQPGSARGEAATPVRYYLLLDGIDGGSTAEGHKGWFEISDYDFDLTNPATTLVSAGRLQFAPLTVTLGLGLGETDLFETIARGLHFTGVRIEGVTADGERAFDLTLGTVFLTQIEDRGGERDALTMVYGQAWLETYTQIEPGVAGPVQRYAWDQLTNKAITEPPPELQPDSAGGEVATPARYYLLIDGVDGGSRAEGHEGWFEISDYDFDMTSPTTIGSVTGGAGAGRLEFPPLTVTLGLGLGQADLFETIARGLHLTGVRFEGVTADGERVFDLTLGSVFLSDIEDRASGLDTLTMGYGQAWLETYTQTDSGEGPVQRYAWDQAANREITDPPPDLQPGSARGEAATPVRYYLLLDGIDGGSTAEGHKGWFEISDYDFDLTNPATTLVSAGRLQFAPLTVTLGLGLGETDLFETIARGLHFTGVRIEGVTADGERAFDLTLGTVFLTQIEDRGGERDALTMVYGQAWLETYTQIEPGVAGPVQRYAWDQLTNKAITEPPPELSPSNIAPTADATNTVVTDEDTASGQVEIGATDADGDTLTYGVKEGSEPDKGSVAFVGGSFVYTPDTNANGADSFTILVDDGQGGTAEQIVTVTINPVNDAPTAAAGNAVITDEDTISLAVPIGAADVDGDPLNYSVKSGFGPAKGSLAFVGGSFVYTPKADANGADSFTILIADGKGGTAEQIVTVTIKPVNDAPTAPIGNTGVLAEDAAPLVVPIGAADVDGDVLTYAVKAGTEPAKGSVTFFGGSFIYTPFANANGADRFTILINDGVSAILEQTVAITINPVNDPAVIGGTRTGSVTEDSGAGQIASGQLTISDVDGASEAAFQAGRIVAAGGFLTLSESGAWTYELDNIIPSVQGLDAGESLTDTVTVRTVDGTTATIVITIHGADEPISNGDESGLLTGTAGDDLIDAQGGDDFVNAGAGGDVVLAGAGDDFVFGGGGNDTITGGEGDDFLQGGDGDDRFIATPGDGNDRYFGGEGIDTLDFSAFITSAVEVSLGGGRSAGYVTGTRTGEDAVSTIENVIGGSGNDNLRGSAGANRLEGRAGDDFLDGSGGNDILIGGSGDDTLMGGGHNDVFVFGPGFGRDTVVDFDDNARGSQDVLDITAFGITFDDFFERVTITDIGNDTRITIDGNSDQAILLEGITNATRITIDDFLLV